MSKKVELEKVRWKPGYRKGSMCSPEVASKEIDKIKAANGGECQPQHVVDAAKPKRHPLHDLIYTIEDVQEAANEHWRAQARTLIASIEVFRPEAPKHATRKYQIDRSTFKPREQAYKDISDIMLDDEARAELLKRALLKLIAIRREFHVLQELAVVFRELDKVLESAD